MLRKISIYFIILCQSFINPILFAQENGKPFIQNYSNTEYGASIQNWSIIEDNRGLIYAGNQDGIILEFDGTSWNHIYITNHSSIRSLAIDKKGIIYVGGVNEFGYLSPDLYGNLQYYSLLSLIDSTNRDFGNVWSLNVLGNKIFFQSKNTLFLYENNHIKHWNLPDMYHRSFVVNNNYYLRQEGLGLTVFKEDTFLLVNDGALFSNEILSAMVPFSDSEILIGSRTKGLYLFNSKKNKISVFVNEGNEFLSSNMLYHGVKIGSDKFAFATLRNGLIIIDKSGKIIQTINKKNGLPTNTTYFIYNQHNQCLWLGMQTHIARIDIGYPMVYWDEDDGIDGTIYNIERINNKFYLGTVQGLYYWERNNKSDKPDGEFNKIDGIASVVWDLFKYKHPCSNHNQENDKLIVGTNEGIYEIFGSHVKQIEKLKWNFRLYSPAKNPHIIFIGRHDGLYQIKYDCNSNTWKPIKKLIDLKSDIRFINEDESHNIWLSTLYNGYYRISFDHISNNNSTSNYSFKMPYKIKNFFTDDGFPVKSDLSIQKIDNELVFLSDSGLFRFNKKTERFYPDTHINNQLSSLNIHRSMQDYKGNIYFDGENFFTKQQDNSYISDPNRLKRIEPLNIYGSYSEDNGNTWFGANNLYKINLNDTINIKKSYQVIFRNIRINNDSILSGGGFLNDSNIVCLKQTDHLKPELNYKYNSIIFEFSAPYYVEQQQVQYSYKLEGFDRSWSDWVSETKKEYTNLHEGTYIFKVKANNVFDIKSHIATYEFSISPPWQRTIFAYIMYFILSIFIISISIRIYTRRLKKANIRLENIVKERTAKIVEQAKELAKLSIVASETNNAISIMDAKGNFEWINNGFTRLHGFTFDEYISKKGNNLINSSTNPDIKKVINKCIKEKTPVIYQSYNISKSNTKIWTQTSLTPILDANKNIVQLVTIEADIRNIKKYEKEIEEKNMILMDQKEELASQRDALIEANATKDKFFSIISHDLKSPFNAILGFAEMLDDNIPVLSKEKIAKFNSHILKSAKQLFSLVENLLSWSRAKTGKIKSYPQTTDIEKLIDDTVAIMIIIAEKKDIQILKEVPPNTFAYVDENLISTVIRNLLSNAIKYSKENSIIAIKVTTKPDHIEISVIDSGIGITKENIAKLFKENIHYTTQGTDQEKGTGLGLILCKDFIEKSGGEIWVDSEPEKGSSFIFTLPKPSR